jgi:hypothetical protein
MTVTDLNEKQIFNQVFDRTAKALKVVGGPGGGGGGDASAANQVIQINKLDTLIADLITVRDTLLDKETKIFASNGDNIELYEGRLQTSGADPMVPSDYDDMQELTTTTIGGQDYPATVAYRFGGTLLVTIEYTYAVSNGNVRVTRRRRI